MISFLTDEMGMQYIKQFFGSIEWFVISLLIVVTPFVYDDKLLDFALNSRYLVLSIFLFILSILFARKFVLKKEKIDFQRIEKIVFGLVLVYFINHIVSSIGVVNKNEAIFKTLKEGALMLFFFFVCINLKVNSQGKIALIKSIIITSLFYQIIAIVQLFQADFAVFFDAKDNYAYYLTQALFDVKSTLSNKNPFSSYMYLSLPFLLYGVVALKKYWKAISIVTLLFTIMFLLLMVSKTVWATLALFTLIMFILLLVYLFYIRPKQTGINLKLLQKIIIVATPIVFVVGGILFLAQTENKIGKAVVEKVMQVINPEEYLVLNNSDRPSSMETRILAWGNTLDMIREKPILGVGPGQWRIMLPKYGVDRFEKDIREGTKHFQRTHNDFLWMLSEIGIFGFLAFISIYIITLVLAVRKFYRTDDNNQRLLSGLIFSALLGYMVILFISFTRERVPHNMLSLAMFSIVLFDYLKPNKEKSDGLNLTRNGMLGFGVFFIVFTIFNVVVSKQMWAGEREARKIQHYRIASKNWRGVIRSGERVEDSYYTMDPYSSPLAFYKGSAYTQLKDIKKANESFVAAYELHPYHIGVLNNLATSYDMLGKPDEALKIYLKALRISPRYFEGLMNTAIIYYNKKDLQKSLDYISRIEYSTKHPERYKVSLMAICRQFAAKNYKNYNRPKLEEWIKDENKIIASFVRFKRSEKTFSQILLKELNE